MTITRIVFRILTIIDKMFLVLYLMFLPAAFFVNGSIARNTGKSSTWFPPNTKTIEGIGILMCREKCILSGGYRSFTFDSWRLLCTLFENARVKNVTSQSQITQLCSRHTTTILVKNGHQRTGENEGIKKKVTHFGQHRKIIPRFLVASFQYGFTYYGFSQNAIVVIKGDGRKRYIVRPITNDIYPNTRNDSNYVLSGTATEHCIDKRVICLYALFHEMDDFGLAPTSKLVLVHLQEPIDPSNVLLKSITLTCAGTVLKSRFAVRGLTIDSQLNLYTLRRNVLYKFEKTRKGFTDCKSIRPIPKGDQMRAMLVDREGRHLTLLMHDGVRIYDMTKQEEKGQLLAFIKLSLFNLYCIDTDHERIVQISKRNLTSVKHCYAESSISLYKCGKTMHEHVRGVSQKPPA